LTRFRRSFATDPSKLIPQSAQDYAHEVPGAGNGSMLNYLSKFVLQMLPTISATVIGAYIVSTWINPKAPAEPTKVASQVQPAQAKAQSGPKASTAEQQAPETAAAQPADTKAAEEAKPVKAAKATDSIRVIPIVRQPAVTEASVNASATDTAPAAEERKDANELARAAIQRLRGSTESARAGEEPAKQPVAPPAPRVQQARVPMEAPQTITSAPTSAPPLPPALSISTPRYPQSDSVDQPTVAQPERVTPPGEIPTARSPLNLQASHRVAENPSIADDFLSATKSFFRAITPQ
jgi:hypothetical protein